jgi:hypothetical protein
VIVAEVPWRVIDVDTGPAFTGVSAIVSVFAATIVIVKGPGLDGFDVVIVWPGPKPSWIKLVPLLCEIVLAPAEKVTLCVPENEAPENVATTDVDSPGPATL